jgi:hypothetical protein
VAVALTTQTSDLNWRPSPFTRDVKRWFGYTVPTGVIAIEIMHNMYTGGRDVRWRVRGDPTIHEMPFENTDERVQAVIIAMKLTC